RCTRVVSEPQRIHDKGRRPVPVHPRSGPPRYRGVGGECEPAGLSHDPGRACAQGLARAQAVVDRAQEHIMALVADEGLGLFCGLNAMPKRSFLAEYSSRITPQKVSK